MLRRMPGSDLSLLVRGNADFALDLLIPKWDLAKSTSQNTTLDSTLVLVCWDVFGRRVEAMRQMEVGGGHILGPEVPIPERQP